MKEFNENENKNISKILRKEHIDGKAILNLTVIDLFRCSMYMGPAMRIVTLINIIKESKKRAYSSYRSLPEVLNKYKISNSFGDLQQFAPGKALILIEMKCQ